jgi:hypothetical protein
VFEHAVDWQSGQRIAVTPHHGIGLEQRVERRFLGRVGDRFDRGFR